jgi:LytTr DNA-binding domain
MINLLRKPYNPIESKKEKFFFTLAFGSFIFLFLFLFKPFGLAQINNQSLFFITLGFGLVTISVMSVFKFIFEPLVIKDKWTFGKSILWGMLLATCIGIANYLYISILFPHLFSFKYILLAIWTAILVGIIPASIGYILSVNKLYKTALREASIVPDELSWESEVVIRGGNPKNESKFNPRNIVFLSSNDNYITVVTIEGDSISKSHLRGTLKGAESELRKNTSFFRCHKCYIVNTEFTDHVTGNAQNMKIKLKIKGPEIPVSRSKAAEAIKRIR